VITLSNLSVSRAGRILFKDLNFTFHESDHWVITGEAGSGKTTLLQLLAGLLQTSKGSIEYNFIKGHGKEDFYAERKNKIIYFPAQALHLFPQNNLYYQQRYYAIGDEHVLRVKDLLQFELIKHLNFPRSFSIDTLMELEVTRLSNGQLKKVLILKNFSSSIPKVVLMDFPFEGLDETSRADLCHFIVYIAEAFKVNFIIVDHHHELPAIINRKMVLRNFKIESILNISPTTITSEAISIRKSKVETANENIVELKNITVQYGCKKIIENFRWTIKKGDRWALIGKNGSGKTTLFSLIYADHPFAYSQQVFLFGKRRGSGESIWDIKKRISYLGPELISFLNPQSILTSVKEYLYLQNENINEKKLEELVIFFNAETLFNTPVRQLSSGQLQLMLLIQFFLKQTGLLLLDEPFQFLDPLQKQQVSQYLATHLSAETTLILITHYKKDMEYWTGLTMEL
jgi:molybdate transport system ATP-binding protein